MKYNAKKTILDGYQFHSQAEAARYWELKQLEKTGEIEKLTLQPEFVLQDKFKDRNGKIHRAIKYKADFKYLDKKFNVIVIEDYKGTITKEYAIKKKLFLKKYGYKYIFLET